jgi:hypothetical protein
VYAFANDGQCDLEGIRERLRSMSGDALLRYGRLAAFMASPNVTDTKPRETFVMQLREARAEWRRRHPPNRSGAAATQIGKIFPN